MTNIKLIPIILLICALVAELPALAEVADENRNEADTKFLTTVAESTNRIMKITDDGLSIPELKLERAGGSVFFLNSSADSNISIEVNYGQKPGYCATGKMEMDKNGIFRTKQPFSPKSFVTVCFPHPGTYPLKIYGLKHKPKGVEGTVIVE